MKKQRKRRFLSIILCFCLFTTLTVPVNSFAAMPDTGNIISPLENADTCKKGHYKPTGYTYQGYTSGYVSSIYDGISESLIIATLYAPQSIVAAATLGSVVFNYLEEHDTITVKYYKYKYYNSSNNNYWYHIIYVETATGTMVQLTCETYYGSASS